MKPPAGKSDRKKTKNRAPPTGDKDKGQKVCVVSEMAEMIDECHSNSELLI